MSHPLDLWGELLWQIGYAICHQLPERSLFLGGYQLPVCARDTGTFLGFGIVLTYYLLGRRWRRAKLPDLPVLVVAMAGFALFAFDALSSYLGVRDTENSIRLISGLGMGSGVGLLLLTVLSYKEGGDPGRRSFTCKDLLALLPLLALLFMAVTTDLGVAWYYLISSLTILFLLLLILTLFYVLIGMLVERRPWGRGRAFPLTLSLLATALLLALAWSFHDLTVGLIFGT